MKVKDIFEDVVKFQSKADKARAKRKKLGQAIRDKAKEQGEQIAKLARDDAARQRRSQMKAVK